MTAVGVDDIGLLVQDVDDVLGTGRLIEVEDGAALVAYVDHPGPRGVAHRF